MGNEIQYSIKDGIGILVINRPDARNALNWTAQTQFANVVREVSANSAIRVLIITGAGDKAFASGGDLKELARSRDSIDGRRLMRTMSEALENLTKLSVPVVAAINGDAIGGGCELLTACDLRIAAEFAQFRFAQVAVGLTTGWGGTWRLVQLIGLSRATQMLLTAQYFTTQEAVEIGFLHDIVPREEDVLEHALQQAKQLVLMPKNSLAGMKKLLWASAGQGARDNGLLESELFTELWAGEDRQKAMRAFLDKKKNAD